MEKLLLFLNGKKGTIASLIGLVNVWLYAKGFVDLDTATLIGGISAVLFGSASYATFKINQPKDVPMAEKVG